MHPPAKEGVAGTPPHFHWGHPASGTGWRKVCPPQKGGTPPLCVTQCQQGGEEGIWGVRGAPCPPPTPPPAPWPHPSGPTRPSPPGRRGTSPSSPRVGWRDGRGAGKERRRPGTHGCPPPKPSTPNWNQASGDPWVPPPNPAPQTGPRRQGTHGCSPPKPAPRIGPRYPDIPILSTPSQTPGVQTPKGAPQPSQHPEPDPGTQGCSPPPPQAPQTGPSHPKHRRVLPPIPKHPESELGTQGCSPTLPKHPELDPRVLSPPQKQTPVSRHPRVLPHTHPAPQT